MLYHASVPNSFWVEDFNTSFYLINSIISSKTSSQSPMELLFVRIPDYSALKVFGCLCYPYLRPYSPSKLPPRSLSCVFIGYSGVHKGHLCFHPPTSRVYVSRHVVFEESIFPYLAEYKNITVASNLPTTTSSHQFQSPPPQPIGPMPVEPLQTTPMSPTTSSPILQSPPLTQPPDPSRHHMMTRELDGTRKIVNRLCLSATKYPLQVAKIEEPTCYSKASANPHWRKAMDEEFNALLHNGTWTLVPSKPEMNVVGCKGIIRVKSKADGSLDRYKARLVAKGFHQ